MILRLPTLWLMSLMLILSLKSSLSLSTRTGMKMILRFYDHCQLSLHLWHYNVNQYHCCHYHGHFPSMQQWGSMRLRLSIIFIKIYIKSTSSVLNHTRSWSQSQVADHDYDELWSGEEGESTLLGEQTERPSQPWEAASHLVKSSPALWQPMWKE